MTTKYDKSGKAPDALLRLGQSLAALKEKEAACAALGEVTRKYPRASGGVKPPWTVSRSGLSAEARAGYVACPLMRTGLAKTLWSTPCPTTTMSRSRSARRKLLFARLEDCAGDPARGLRRPRFNRADVACGALAPRPDAWSALLAVTVDHGLRPEAAREARDVKRLATPLDLEHRTLRWTGQARGIAGRGALGALSAAGKGGAGQRRDPLLTAHTRDDQAETLLMRMLRGSGIAGLAAMARRPSATACGWRGRSGRSEIAADRDAATRRRSASPTIRPTATPASPVRGCAP